MPNKRRSLRLTSVIGTDRQTDKQTNRQTDKQTKFFTFHISYWDRQTNRQTDKQTNRQTDKQTNRQTDKQTNRQSSLRFTSVIGTDRQTDKVIYVSHQLLGQKDKQTNFFTFNINYWNIQTEERERNAYFVMVFVIYV
jgi:hypothetical protein